jgi:acetate kinase
VPSLNVVVSAQRFGIELDEARNTAAVPGGEAEVQADGSRVKVLVIPTDEELSIAQQTLGVVAASQVASGA